MSRFCGFEIQDSEEFGRFVVAKQDYRIGELILHEEPLLIYPVTKPPVSFRCQDLPEDIDISTFECVGCFKFLTVENALFCGKCHWPVCSQECGLESLHAKYECSLFEEKKIGVSAKVYAHISILRAILMYRDQNTAPLEHFSSLCSEYNISHKDYNSVEENYRVKIFLRKCFQMNVDARIIGQIIGTCSVNGFEMSGKDEIGDSYRGQAVYHVASMFAHSCAPNATWSILPYDYNGIRKWHIRIYSRRNIYCNESINISYIPGGFSLETAERKQYIMKNYHFVCKCSRCSDPTEFSFYTEAVICSSCGDETLTADDTSDENSAWTCSYCGVSKPCTYAKTCVKNFDPSFIWNSVSQTAQAMTLTWSTEKCRLSQNHREIIRTSYYWLEYRSFKQFPELLQQTQRCDEIFVKFMKTATKCLKMFRMFGTMINIVEMEWCFARIIAGYYFKTGNFLSIAYDPYSPEEKLKIITAICVHLKTAYDTMHWFCYDYLVVMLRPRLIDGYKFWNDELNALKAVPSVDMSDSSNELLGNGIKVRDKVAELKSSPNDLNDPLKEKETSSELLKETAEVDEVSVSESSGVLSCDVVDSSGGSNLTPLKPLVSLLTKWDFYFDA